MLGSLYVAYEFIWIWNPKPSLNVDLKTEKTGIRKQEINVYLRSRPQPSQPNSFRSLRLAGWAQIPLNQPISA